MISSKKLFQLARKWRTTAVIGRRRITLGRTSSKKSSRHSKETRVTQKGHFAVYSTDGRRFEIPKSCLVKGVIPDLFMIAEEEFGIPSDGPSYFH